MALGRLWAGSGLKASRSPAPATPSSLPVLLRRAGLRLLPQVLLGHAVENHGGSIRCRNLAAPEVQSLGALRQGSALRGALSVQLRDDRDAQPRTTAYGTGPSTQAAGAAAQGHRASRVGYMGCPGPDTRCRSCRLPSAVAGEICSYKADVDGLGCLCQSGDGCDRS